MKNNPFFLDKISNTAILILILILFFLKIIVFGLVNLGMINFIFGGGSDAGYYNAYAEGGTNNAVNIWPVILRYLNDRGLYSRDGISYILFFSNIFIIPILATRLSGLELNRNQKYYLYSFLIYLLYPTMFLYTFDVYRDVFMVLTFLIGCLVVKVFLNTSNIILFSIFFIISFLIGLFLIDLRPYLGYAFLLAMFSWKIKFTKRRLAFFITLYLLILFVANYMGLLSDLTEYRSGFEEAGGGSTLGLNFSNPILFIPNFILSMLGQLFGLYITNPLAVFLLLIETIPFFYMLIYIIKNIKLADSFVRFLIIFFVAYASIWLIGNDNLGTAVRLRIYNYLAIYICFFYILRIKMLNLIKK